MKWAAVLGAFACLSGARAQECNVEDASVNIVNYVGFPAADVIPRVPAVVENGLLKIGYKDFTGVHGQVWVRETERFTDGFIATTKFSIDNTGGDQAIAGDGFAFVVQSETLDNIQSGVGRSLGFRNGVQKYLAVGVETCTDNVQPCVQTARIYIREPGQIFDELNAATFTTVITNGAVHELKVVYTADDQGIRVDIDGATVVSSSIPSAVGTLEDLLGTRFGFFGFTASSSDMATADVFIHEFRLDVQPSDNAIATATGQVIDWGRTVIFELAKRDNCQRIIPFNGTTEVVEANITLPDRFDPAARPEDLVEGDDFFNAVISFNAGRGTYSLQFTLPFLVEGPWTLQAAVDDVAAAGSPILEAVVTREPLPPTGIPTWGLALLISIISLIVIGLVYSVVRLRRYRQKLKENAEDIDAGKEKHKLDVLDQEVSYSMNPMLGSLEEMKKKLAENEKELERLQSGKSTLYDDDYTIEALQKQNQELRDEMNNLKKKHAQEEALKSNFRTAQPGKGTNAKKQFEQTRTS